jgi:hypothetical protein
MAKYYNCECGATVINKTCHFISRRHIEGLKFVEQQRLWKEQTDQSIQKQIASLRQSTGEPTDAYRTTS